MSKLIEPHCNFNKSSTNAKVVMLQIDMLVP